MGGSCADALELANVAWRFAIGTGMKFDHRGAESQRGIELGGVRFDEQGGANSGLAKSIDVGCQMLAAGDRVEAALGSALFAFFGNDTSGVRLVAQGDLQHLRRRRHFQVEGDGNFAAEAADVIVGNVAAILAQVRRNPVGARLYRQRRGMHRIRMAAAAGIADRRHMIDVHAQSQMAIHCLVSKVRGRGARKWRRRCW